MIASLYAIPWQSYKSAASVSTPAATASILIPLPPPFGRFSDRQN